MMSDYRTIELLLEVADKLAHIAIAFVALIVLPIVFKWWDDKRK
ncbi:hypothetical protein [Shouchella shacheensis]|nr:hypothetical protein [Shouchella shacheensis]